MHGDGAVVVRGGLALEPLHPPQHGVDAPAGPHRLHDVEDQAGHPVAVAGGLGVVDGRLRQAVGLAPRGRSTLELRDHLRLAPPQFGVQQLPEQLVVPVPLASTVERDDEQVPAFQLFQRPAGPPPPDDGVAQRAGHPLEDRRSGEERHLGARHPVEELGAEVVVDVAVVAGERHRGLGPRAPGLHRQRRQVQTGGPALGAGHEGTDLVGVELDARLGQEIRGLIGTHREVGGADLHDPALGPQPGRRELEVVAGGEDEPRSGREGQGQLGDDVKALPAGDHLGVVDHERDGPVHERDGRHEVGYDGHAGPRGRQRPEHRRLQRFDAVEGHREVRQQDGGIVVVVVSRQPRHPRLASLHRLRQQRRLAVSRRRHDRDDAGTARVEDPIEQPAPRHDPGAHHRYVQLRLGKLEGGLRRRPPIGPGHPGAIASGRFRHLSEGTSSRVNHRPTSGRRAPGLSPRMGDDSGPADCR